VKHFTTRFNYSGSGIALKSVAAVFVMLVVLLGGPDSLARKRSAQDPLHDYYAMLSQFWGRLYARGGVTLYCARTFGMHKGSSINAEHVFPMSWVARALHCGKRNQCRRNNPRFRSIETDMHNIWPARREVNEARRNYRYAIIRGEHYRFGRCDFEVNEAQRIVEPRPAVRGEIARSMFYMHAAYGLYLQPRLAKLLSRWNRQDPPNREERRRNDVIETLQGRRNRFIDHPELISALVQP